jgi:hypothetical protein
MENKLEDGMNLVGHCKNMKCKIKKSFIVKKGYGFYNLGKDKMKPVHCSECSQIVGITSVQLLNCNYTYFGVKTNDISKIIREKSDADENGIKKFHLNGDTIDYWELLQIGIFRK